MKRSEECEKLKRSKDSETLKRSEESARETLKRRE